MEDFISTLSNLDVYIIYASTDMSPRTDKETRLLLYFLPSWCLEAIHDPQPSHGKVIRPLNLWGAKLRRRLTTFLPNLLLAWAASAVCLARVSPELHSPG